MLPVLRPEVFEISMNRKMNENNIHLTCIRGGSVLLYDHLRNRDGYDKTCNFTTACSDPESEHEKSVSSSEREGSGCFVYLFLSACLRKKCKFSSFPCKIPVPLSQLVREKNFPLRVRRCRWEVRTTKQRRPGDRKNECLAENFIFRTSKNSRAVAGFGKRIL